MVNDHEEELNILMHCINLAEYRRFKVHTPSVAIATGGNVLEIVYHQTVQDTPENALFCLRFVNPSSAV